ncbi:hypothetical protein FRB96_002569 [Tulasnella sp. 330]|nr:hypothetical protein FRB96_002569 [Tulasnella sp. 330]KAG8873128.1 hypothetical protein FRB97_006997 [Tulasnella sp. 331]
MSSPTIIPPGVYTVTNKMSGAPVGCAGDDDPRIVVLDNGTQPPTWVVETNGSTNVLKVMGVPVTGSGGGILVAGPNPGGNPLWMFLNSIRDGQDCYAIVATDRITGWVVAGDEPNAPIVVRPLITIPTWPPAYPPNEVFTFTRVGDA